MKIVNIVCSGNFNQPIPLESLFSIDKYHYDPELYQGGYVDLSAGKATLYKNGKYIIVGLKAITEVNNSFNELKNLLSQYIDTSYAIEPVIYNIVAIDNIERKIDLKNFIYTFRRRKCFI